MNQDIVIINGSYHNLKGDVYISGAKNAALPILIASLLTNEEVTIYNVPNLSDVDTVIKIIQDLGAYIAYDIATETVTIKAKQLNSSCDSSLISKMRASFLIFGPLLARNYYGKISLPGGCSIGKRPIDLHLQSFVDMGMMVYYHDNYIIAENNDTHTTYVIEHPYVSVGATENILMAASLGHKKVILKNAAQEPEIIDLANFLIAMGANITGHGSSVITIEGVEKLNGCKYTIIPDRIEACSYAMLAIATQSKLTLHNIKDNIFAQELQAFKQIGAQISFNTTKDKLYIANDRPIIANDIVTKPFPGFSTDLQSMYLVLMCIAEGNSTIIESIFENRFQVVEHLCNMGAHIDSINKQQIYIHGKQQLYGTTVQATDLRSGFALIIAGIIAQGQTTITNLYHIHRGYHNLLQKLHNIGIDIEYSKN